MSDQHTPGPWVDDGYAHIGAVNDQLNGGYFIALCEGPDRVANARRIVACVNACAGIPSEMLEAMPSGPVSLLPMYARIEKQRDELLAALEYANSIIGFVAKEWSERVEVAFTNVKGTV